MRRRLTSLLLVALLVFFGIAAVYADSTYTIKPGDILWKIAESKGTTWEKLAEANKLENPHQIYPGQVLKLVG